MTCGKTVGKITPARTAGRLTLKPWVIPRQIGLTLVIVVIAVSRIGKKVVTKTTIRVGTLLTLKNKMTKGS